MTDSVRDEARAIVNSFKDSKDRKLERFVDSTFYNLLIDRITAALQKREEEIEQLRLASITVPLEYDLMYKSGFQNVTDLLGKYGDLQKEVNRLNSKDKK